MENKDFHTIRKNLENDINALIEGYKLNKGVKIIDISSDCVTTRINGEIIQFKLQLKYYN